MLLRRLQGKGLRVSEILQPLLFPRFMMKGQLAMVHAMAYPDPEKGGRGKKSESKRAALGAGVFETFLHLTMDHVWM